MIKFKLTSKNGSKYSYEFDTAGLNGIFTVDIDTSEVEFTKLDGIFKDNDKAKKDVLYGRKAPRIRVCFICKTRKGLSIFTQ